jgi:predicted alpha/beta-fold hydrolase
MHGLTGGSEMNYVRALVQSGTREGYLCLCFNSRGINTEMSSPMPFIGIGHEDL